MQQTFPCPKCGSQSVVGQRFCEACGERFPYNCPVCGAIIEPAYKACPNCRTKLGWGKQQRKPLPGVARAYQERQRTSGYGGGSQEPKKKDAWLGVCLGSMAILLCIGAVFYAIGGGFQGKASGGLTGGFIFQEMAPAPTLTPPPGMEEEEEEEQEPAPVADLPSYTADEVMALAKSFSPDCRKRKPG
jgi:hypothetical protein